MKKLRVEAKRANLLALCNNENLKQIKRQMLAHSRSMGKGVTHYIRDVSKLLSRIAANQDKNIEPQLQAEAADDFIQNSHALAKL